MNCPNCGAVIQTSQCPYCGTAVQDGTSTQAQQPITIIINNTNPANNPGAGAYPGNQAFSAQPNYANSPQRQSFAGVSQKSKGTAIALCCLGFLGLGGLHHFYVGKSGVGILYFLTFGLFFIGTIIDLIALVNNDFTDGNGLKVMV